MGQQWGNRDGGKKNAAGERANEENAEKAQKASSEKDEEANASATAGANLDDSANITAQVLEVICDFCKDTKQQLNDIKSELASINQIIVEAEM